MLPVVRTGQSQLVDDDFALEDGLWFEAAPGHTPGNVVIHARSGDDRAVFLGDVLHHPLQLAKPEWSTLACTDRELVAQDPHPADRRACRARHPAAAGAFPDADRRAASAATAAPTATISR